MAEREINWTRKALEDKTAIMEYWYFKTRSVDYPVKLERLISSTLSLVSVQPRIGPIFDEKRNIRYACIRDHKIYYTFTDRVITVLTIWDTRRDQKNLDV
ncbi:MAG TPA: type II toxin-antitoxin system RelE/ParE family toxin [Balneolaceae bacterium]|nr:type II toxin-antitoxin system RelE/ParE family toxin [Balneolaceae bacterium]